MTIQRMEHVGTRMFDAVTESHRPLELLFVVHTSTALHLRARIVR